MSQGRYRVLFISSQPMQNAAPLRLLAQHPQLEMQMAYCSLPTNTHLWQGWEYLNKDVFDTPMMDGYPWIYVPNRSLSPSLGRFWGLLNPGLVKMVSKFDCCIVYGHAYASFWLAIATAKFTGKPLLLSTDATYLESAAGGNWKVPLKRQLLPYLYNRVADAVLVPSTAAKRFIHSLGVPEKRIFVTPYVVDNEAITSIASQANRQKIRESWQISEDALIILFCAKFIERKRPQDVLQAFAIANIPHSYLVLVGEGPLGDELRATVEQLGINEQVRFLGFVKYSQLPEVYATCDLLVHPAEWEPYGLIVNEAMVCGIPVIVSDRVGASYDLIQDGVTGFTYPCGDVGILAELLRKTLTNRVQLKQMGKVAKQRMETWSSRENAAVTVEAIRTTIDLKQNNKS